MQNDATGLANRSVSKSIVLIDDDVLTERIITTVFRHLDLATTCTSNWREGIEIALAQHDSASQEPVAIVNMNMPELGGWSAIRELRNRGFDEPIVALTTDDPQKCLDAGCDDFLRKPIDHDSLITVVEKYVKS